MINTPIKQDAEAKPEWQRPVISTIDIKRTLAGSGGGLDGSGPNTSPV